MKMIFAPFVEVLAFVCMFSSTAISTERIPRQTRRFVLVENESPSFSGIRCVENRCRAEHANKNDIYSLCFSCC